MNNSNVLSEVITNGSNPRSITMEEIGQLYSQLIDQLQFEPRDDGELETIRARIRQELQEASIAVFDVARPYPKKVAVVVWAMNRGQAEVIAWDEHGCSQVEIDQAWSQAVQ